MKVSYIHEYKLSDGQELKLEDRHICSIKVMDNINSPILKVNDIIHFIMSEKVNIKDFILYKNYDKYFIRRIIKITKKGVYVAGDNENKYHLISQNDIVGRAVGRERGIKYLSFTLKPRYRLYALRKTKINYLRLKNRITDYDEEVNEITLRNLKSNTKKSLNEKKKIKEDLEIDDAIKIFINPNEFEIPTDDYDDSLDDLNVKEEDLPSIEEDIANYENMDIEDDESAEGTSDDEKNNSEGI